MQRIQRVVVLTGVAILAALAGALVARSLIGQRVTALALESGTLIDPPRPVAEMSLVDHHGAPFTRERLQGRRSLVFFGFTHCGDICPLTLTLLANAAKSLGDLPADQAPQLIFVSVDHLRDTPETMRAYLKGFAAPIIGVTGTRAALDTFTQGLGIPSTVRTLENGGIAVDHSAAILLFDREGAWRALFSPPHSVDKLARDYRRLIGKT